MTTAPARPLLHAYLGDGDPMEIVDSPFGRMEREKAKAMATGEFSGLVELSKKIRNDAATITAKQDAREAELNARQDAIAARELQHAVNVTNFVDFVGKASVLLDRVQRMRADAERKPEPLATPPGATPPGSDDAPAHIPSGELHDVQAKNPEQHGLPAATADEFPAGGDLYLNTPIPLPATTSPTTDPVTRDQDEEPVGGVEFTNPELPKPPQEFRSPIAAGLDSEE